MDSLSNLLLEEIDAVSSQTEMTLALSVERIKARKGRFNLFTTLLQAHDETRLHSRFLHFLLNPSESHDCGDLFLKAFLEVLPSSDERLNSENYASAQFRSGRTEQKTNFGRFIDIYLEFNSGKIAIENKVWAVEQKNQIEDYAAFIDSADPCNLLLYLTLHGTKSETANGKDYLCISYEKHILEWLENCLSRTYGFPNLNIALQQYRRVVQGLLGRHDRMGDINEVKKHITKNSNFLENFEVIKQAVDELYNDAWRYLLADITHSIRKNSNGIELLGCKEGYGDQENPRSYQGDTWVNFVSSEGLSFYIGTCKSARPFRVALTMSRGKMEGVPEGDDREDADAIYRELKDRREFKDTISQGWWGVFYYLNTCPQSLEDAGTICSLLDKGERDLIVNESFREIKSFVQSADEVVKKRKENILRT